MTRLLSHIPLSAVMPKREEILRRMRYHSKKTVLSPQDEALMADGITQSGGISRPAGIYGLYPVTERTERGLVIGGAPFQSASLAQLLGQSEQAVLMAATVGDGPADAIDALSRQNRLSDAVILDAIASEMTDHCLDYMTGVLSREWARRGYRTTRRRYSPGYGDLAITLQQYIYDLLNAGRLGIEITDTCMLRPLKSVFAILGLERNEKQ
mgnify:CR=1 FL=1